VPPEIDILRAVYLSRRLSLSCIFYLYSLMRACVCVAAAV